MAKTEYVRARVEPELKQEVEEIFQKLGLTVTQAITLFLKQVQYHRGLPFSVRLPDETTRESLQEAEQEDLESFDDPEDLFEDLDI